MHTKYYALVQIQQRYRVSFLYYERAWFLIVIHVAIGT